MCTWLRRSPPTGAHVGWQTAWSAVPTRRRGCLAHQRNFPPSRDHRQQGRKVLLRRSLVLPWRRWLTAGPQTKAETEIMRGIPHQHPQGHCGHKNRTATPLRGQLQPHTAPVVRYYPILEPMVMGLTTLRSSQTLKLCIHPQWDLVMVYARYQKQSYPISTHRATVWGMTSKYASHPPLARHTPLQ